MKNQERMVQLGEHTKGRFSSKVALRLKVCLLVEKKVEVYRLPRIFFYNVSILHPGITGNARLQIKQSSKNSYSKGPESNQDNQDLRERDYRQKETVEK